jgi:hypothetical protein
MKDVDKMQPFFHIFTDFDKVVLISTSNIAVLFFI